MTAITAVTTEHPEPGYPPHWVHFKLDRPLFRERLTLGDPPIYFRDLVVSHQTGFLGAPETVLLPADNRGQPLSGTPLRTVEDEHASPNDLVLHYLTRHTHLLG